MKKIILFVALALPISVLAEIPPAIKTYDQLNTLNNREYTNVRVTEKSAYSITFFHSTGAARISYEQLSDYVLRDLGFASREDLRWSQLYEQQLKQQIKLRQEDLRSRQLYEQQLKRQQEENRRYEQKETVGYAQDLDATVTELYGDGWQLSFLVGTILAWVIGLTPPFFIRYAIMKKPIHPFLAAVIATVFCFFNLVIMIMLGSQSKSHALLVFIAFIAFGILKGGAAAKEASKPN